MYRGVILACVLRELNATCGGRLSNRNMNNDGNSTCLFKFKYISKYPNNMENTGFYVQYCSYPNVTEDLRVQSQIHIYNM
jgi:hypothetical protein